MATGPKISVVMATYNQSAYLSTALDSVLSQDIPAADYEVIVVDDGSTDRTPELLQSHGERLVLLNQSHQGLSAACNLGLGRARGKYFARMDSDDVVDPSWLRREMQILDKNPEACCVCCDYDERTPDGKTRTLKVSEDNLFSFWAAGPMFRTETLRSVGGFRSLYWEEYDLFLRLKKHGRFIHLPLPLYSRLEHPDSMINKTEQRRAGWWELLRMWGAAELKSVGSSPELDEILLQAAGAGKPGK